MAAHDLSTPAASADARWSVRLLGSIEATGPLGRIEHWPSRAVAALLGRLALTPERAHAREELVEMLWPGVALDIGRNRLRQVLSTLKSMLEEGGEPVISADRSMVRLVRGTLDSDAARFERLARGGALAAARAAYAGELMPGHYDEWVLEARAQLAALHERVDVALERLPVAAAADPLPAPWTRAFGLEQPLARLEALLQTERLVTLTGPGGCGKTRLALEAARALAGRATPQAQTRRFARIVFVPLAECRDGAEATAALALRLHLSGRDPLGDLPALLGDAPALLVLDNVEQLLPEVRSLLQRLLRDCAGMHLLVTSRAPCGLPGEQVVPSSGLPVPAAQMPAAALIDNPAVALFIDRARAARPGLGTDHGTLSAVAALVRLLEGLPLALELVAAHCASFTPEQLYGLLTQAQRESRSLSLLTRPGPTHGDHDRHASIEAVLDWSWRLLDDATKATLAAVGVFSGDAGLPGVAAVLGESAARVAPRIDTLLANSLLQRAAPLGAAHARFTLAQPVYEFLGRRVEAAVWAQLRHALLHWLLDWASDLAPSEPMTVVKAEWPTVLERLAGADADPAQRLALLMALRSWIESGGLPALVQGGLADALEQAENHPAVPASEVHELLAYLRFEAGLVAQARAHADAALRFAGADPCRRARALVRRAWVDLAAGHGNDNNLDVATEQTQRLAEALGLAQGAGDAEGQARALHQQAVVETRYRADWAHAESLLARSQALWLRLGDRRKAFARLRNRGQCWVHLGRTVDARACFEQCARAADEDGDVIGRIDSLLSLSSLLAARRQWASALAADRDCLRLAWRHWHRHGLAYALWNPPLALAHLGKPEEAQMLMAFTTGLWEGSFGPLARDDRRMVQRVQRLVRVQVGATRAEVLWLEGAAMNVARAIECALQTCAALIDCGGAQVSADALPP